jgi:hypothetical protein
MRNVMDTLLIAERTAGRRFPGVAGMPALVNWIGF